EAGFRAQGGFVDLMNILAVQAIAYERLGESETALALANEALEIGARNQAAGSHSFEMHAFLPQVFIRAWGRACAAREAQRQAQREGVGDASSATIGSNDAAQSAEALGRLVRLCLRGAARYSRLFRIGQPTLLLNRARACAVKGRMRDADR